jgi:serine/threonine protein phosphatase PrpC
MFDTAFQTVGYRRRNEDRVHVIPHADGVVVLVADGAGGTSGGAEAADTVCLWVRAYATRAERIDDAPAWAELLGRIDRQIAECSGQAAAAVVAWCGTGLFGASVGDCAAWHIGGDAAAHDDLTHAQVRKPLLGTGEAKPVAFERPGASTGTLLVASDGLVKYTAPARIREVVAAGVGGGALQPAAAALIDLVRLRSGALPDDVTVALCRPRTARALAGRGVASASRRRFTLSDDGRLTEDEAGER